MKQRSEKQLARLAEILGVTYKNLTTAIEVLEKEEAAERAKADIAEGEETSDKFDDGLKSGPADQHGADEAASTDTTEGEPQV